MKPDDINDHPALLIYETNIPVNTYACNNVITPITLAKITRPTAAQAIAIDCGEIILPVTPPLVFAATSRVSETLICCAVVDCSEPNRAFEEVSEPVRNTPSQPRNGEKNGNITPVPASTSANVVDMPE